MSGNGLHTEHPTDALPAYARGVAETDDIAAHVETCASCRAELEILGALANVDPEPMTDIERRAVYRAFEARRAIGPGARSGPGWLSATWRAAAAIALVVSGVGVWKVVEAGSGPSDWNPDAALAGFVEDLADLDLAADEASAALGPGLLDDPGLGGGAWEAFDGDVAIPWEEDR